MSTRTFQTFLSSPELQRLARVAQAQRQLDAQWRAALPAGLAGLSEVVGIQGECLLVATRSAAVATKLRQMETRLIMQLNDKGLKINAIRCRIQVEPLPHQQKAPKRTPVISPKALATLNAAAESLPPSPLRDALAALVAKRRRKNSFE
ncbi:hypothetical protein GCM10007907_13560 [Chitinimonas prasina]|uniref:DUF721 domain-containing protein n=1 Tax=Chitinimonas prasina TaxID=1434937 RepID=A0ABQ5YDD0_9NEIS|nr:DUF721 domain-containing protein [Chitinimonas prasina]GLR12566.1 hypothetical protein GCM10007907_13560 [Chitinimonas prasina]